MRELQAKAVRDRDKVKLWVGDRRNDGPTRIIGRIRTAGREQSGDGEDGRKEAKAWVAQGGIGCTSSENGPRTGKAGGCRRVLDREQVAQPACQSRPLPVRLPGSFLLTRRALPLAFQPSVRLCSAPSNRGSTPTQGPFRAPQCPCPYSSHQPALAKDSGHGQSNDRILGVVLVHIPNGRTEVIGARAESYRFPTGHCTPPSPVSTNYGAHPPPI